MPEASDPLASHPTAPARPAPVWPRLLAALAASSAAAVILDRLAAGILVTDAPLASLAAVLLALAIGIPVARRALAPVTDLHAELQDRYRAALEDALRDPLTGLGNHRSFHEELDRHAEQTRRYGMPVALVVIDLDEFKTINDAQGHVGGDRALQRIGQLLAGAIRRPDRAFRIGGDEFALLLPHTDAEGARVVARRLLAAALHAPLVRGDGGVPISFSAGISAMPQPAASRAELYAQADAALFVAKRAGRTEVAIFDPASTPGAGPSPATTAAVIDVIASRQLRPVYQPIVELATGRILGYEGLVRPVAPAPFPNPGALFQAAEQSGHLIALDLACVDLLIGAVPRLPSVPPFVSVNLSPRTVEAPEFNVAALLTILGRHDFPPQRLVLELTEREPIGDVHVVRHKLETCRQSGIRLAADDLGAGNAGLRLLSELRFDILKVDLSLVQRSAAGSPSSAVLGSVVDLAARSDALLVAEGVEEPEQVVQLRALGVRAAQGFLLGPPAPPETLAVALPTDTGGVLAWRRSIGLPVGTAASAGQLG